MNNNNSSKATNKYLRLSPHKARRILEQIRGKKYNEAILILNFLPYRSCKTITKILQSAYSNIISNTTTEIDKNQLIIKKAFANPGPILKRFKPRAQGRAFPIRKPTCHITVELENI
uniref:Large ribosomal subunit protein uL22c n=1 Tax=Caloglossa intermedia TaxID=100879 RepID=A0A1Z1M5X7_9FLOR|nr:ribosomal protein L22 [Caloglossa intermedia]ARW61497.1 ribosomal protein L22 [Caloglossa intermedia]